MQKRLTRRDFLKGSAVAAGAVAGAPYALSQEARRDTLGVAVIGAGGMGGFSVDMACRERVVAVCDVDENHLAHAMRTIAERLPNAPPPQTFHDYRRMYDAMARNIDVVLISTPDHQHATPAMRAIELRKATFVQKPLGYNIQECRELARAARSRRVLTQMGNQGHFGDAIRRACELIWDGAIGEVTETHTILGRNFGGVGGRPASKPVPAHVHWDEWIGPAAVRDFHDGLHPFGWRDWREFGTGTIGDMACHNLDVLYWALKIQEAPRISVECLGTNGGSAEMFPQNNIVRYDIPARANMGPLKVFVYDHVGLKPPIMAEAEREHEIKFSECTLFVGSRGRMWTTGTAGNVMLLPLDRHAEYQTPARTLPRAHGGPIEDLYHVIRNGGTPCSNFPDSAGPLTEFALLGYLAQNAGVGKKLEWDVPGMRCTNDASANRWVRRRYRRGWGL
ncbi:MAG TPA: Gfo/Idh/MocA family oxidoreductase [Chthonomonadales bacterium]|nr:Gfo/Idh/MocA family oxidoreductase [Chthonomonadales bacterium]